jgi:hypothetical protein
MGSNTERNRCACSGDLNFFIRLSRCRVGWWEFSARLLRYRSVDEGPAATRFASQPHSCETVSDHHARLTPRAMKQLAEKALCRHTIPLWLDQNVNYGTLLIYRSPEILLHSVDL